MKNTLWSWLALGLLASACGGTQAAAPGTAATTPSAEAKYDIAIFRPFKRGQRVRVEVEASEDVDAVGLASDAEDITAEGVTRERQVSLKGIFVVQKVDDTGRVRVAAFDVESFVDTREQAEILPAGTKLAAGIDEDGEVSVFVDGVAPRPDVAEWLEMCFPMSRPGGAMGDVVFGTAEPKAIGETWDVSSSIVTEDLLEEGYVATESNTKGQATLLGIVPCAGGDCLELAGRVDAAQVTVSQDMGVDNLQGGKVEGEVRLLLPVDLSQPAFLEDGKSTATFSAHLKGEESSAQAQISVSRRRVATYAVLRD